MDKIKCCWYKNFPDECCSNSNSIRFRVCVIDSIDGVDQLAHDFEN